MSPRTLHLKSYKLFLSSIAIVILLCGWLYGALLLIEIDSEEYVQRVKSEKFMTRNQRFLNNVDKQCRQMEIRQLERITSDESPRQEALHALERAKREKIIRDNLVFFPQLKQMWCLVPKAASTTWSKVILEELNAESMTMFVDPKSNDSLQVTLKENFGRINRAAFVHALNSPDIKKVLLVRHPFLRIISAYKNKLEHRKSAVDGMHFYQLYGAKMSRKFRVNRKLSKQREPTFQEFVDFLLDSKSIDYNEHWQPISILCGLCHIRYDHVIVQEDLHNDYKLHLKALNFSTSRPFPAENRQAPEDYRNIWNNVSAIKKTKLLSIFQDDFKLLGYNFLNF